MKNSNLRQSPRQSTRYRLVIAAAGFAVIVGFLIFLFYNLGSPSVTKGAPGKHGAKTVSSANTKVNEYTYLTSNAAVGATTISVNSGTINANSRFSGNLSSGELLLIIQMQGATYTTTNGSSYGNITAYNNAGKYEFAEVSSVSGSTITLTTGLKYAYTSAGAVQVVRVPRYTTLTVNSGASITTDAWDGTKGGIIAIEVSGITTINGTIDASALGFRGGVVNQNANTSITSYCSSTIGDGAQKGESIGGASSSYAKQYCKGAVANGGGGGNAHNAGGGGGANGGATGSWTGTGNPDNTVSGWSTAWNLESSNFATSTSSGGGRGGYGWSSASKNPKTVGPNDAQWSGDSRPNTGGLGGRPLDYSSNTKVFFGGGGGAGNSNNSTGTSGGNGGGIVFLLGGGNISGSGSIIANGQSVATSVSTSAQNGDGSGGGGGGGSVIVYLKNATLSNISIQANGGDGGDQDIAPSLSPETEGPGGGGGGGYIATTNSTSVTKTANGGQYGVTNSGVFSTFTANGATSGGTGTTAGTAPSNPYSGTSTLPVELTSFSAMPADHKVILKWTTATEHNNDFFSIDRSTDGINFDVIEYVNGLGNSSQPKEYTFTDNYPIAGTSYYRLRQTDFNGQSATFKVIPVDFNVKLNGLVIVNAAPNPFYDDCTITFSSDKESMAEVTIYSQTGVLIKNEKIAVSKGTNLYRFENSTALAPGTYFVSIARDGEKAVGIKLMKRSN